MNNTEIFELCENSSKQQCTDCNTYWEIDIVYCSCGRIFLKYSQRPKEFEKNNFDVSSIPGYVIEKNSSRGAKHGPSERQRLYYKARRDASRSTEAIHPYLQDGIITANTEIRCHSFDGPIARRTYGKDSARLQNHSSQSTIRQRKGHDCAVGESR